MNREITLGAILQVVAYMVMVVYFAAELRVNQGLLTFQLDRMEKRIEVLSFRVDKHIDSK